jgi:hypothetical protein
VNEDSSESTSEQADAESPTAERILISVAVGSIALAHEYAFWNPFGINVLEHVGFADLPRLAIWPIIAISAGLVGSLIISAFAGITLAVHAEPEKEHTGPETAVERRLKRLKPGIALLLFIVGMIVLPLDFSAAWFFGTVVLTSASWMAFNLHRRFEDELPRDLTVLWVLFFSMAFGIGRHEAYGILSGDACLQVAFKGSTSNALRYIGRAGDYVFIWDPEAHRTEIERLEDITPLNLSLGKDQCKKARSLLPGL